MNSVFKYIQRNWFEVVIVGSFIFFMFYKPIICGLLLGMYFLYMNYKYFLALRRIHKNPVRLNAKIVEYQIAEEGYKEPAILFYAKEGNEIYRKPAYYFATGLSKIRTYKNKINQTIEIIYNQNNPYEFVIASENKWNYLVLVFTSIISLISIVISLSFLFGIIELSN